MTSDMQTAGEISAQVPDWSREATRHLWDPAKQLLRCMRTYEGIAGDGTPRRRPGPMRRRWLVLQHRFWSIICGCEIHLGTSVSGGLILPHPVGVVIHPRTQIGPNCIIFQNVTLGTNRGTAVPRIGGHVDIGPGAVVIGDVTIGDHAVIGANAVVLQDVPAGAMVGGVPARILRHASNRKIA